jgi:rhodanese-related sulfurtransferase
MNTSIKGLLWATAAVMFLASPLWGQDFPGRVKYPAAKPIGTEDLHEAYQRGKAVIVDVRSTIEYDVIHPVGALHIPVSDMRFEKSVQDLAAISMDKTIAFYCNGITCLKSYEATIRATNAGVKNCYVYDAGIPDWAEKYPGKTLLLGKPIIDSKTQLIPKAVFAKKNITFEEFKKAAAQPNSLVIDVRDHVQNSGKLPGIVKSLTIPLDNFIPNFVKNKANQDKKLLIFDQVGKQVEWLEYYLVEAGYTDYAFLKDGATAVLGEQTYK